MTRPPASRLWRFYTVPGIAGRTRATRPWRWPRQDLERRVLEARRRRRGLGQHRLRSASLNRIYIGTGNASPYDPAMRSPGGGDNLFPASIVALDADTGKYVWHYQENPARCVGLRLPPSR